jgi:hypothetical protein
MKVLAKMAPQKIIPVLVILNALQMFVSAHVSVPVQVTPNALVHTEVGLDALLGNAVLAPVWVHARAIPNANQTFALTGSVQAKKQIGTVKELLPQCFQHPMVCPRI